MQRFTLLAVLALLGCVGAVSFGFASQVQNENLANAVVAARQKNAALMQQFTWTSRIEIDQDGKMQDIRIDQVTCDSTGALQRTVLNDQQGAMPGLFLRKAIEQGQREQVEAMVKGLSGLVDQYTLPSAGKVVAFLVQAQVQPITTPQGTTVLQVSGNNVVVPGDTFTMILDGTTLAPTSVQITSTFDGNPVTVKATFMNRSGLNLVQFATAEVPSKKVVVTIHNFDVAASN